MEPFCCISFWQKEGAILDVQSFQEAIRFPLAWRVHFRFHAYAFEYDGYRDRFTEACIRVSIARCTFVNSSGDFAWNAFHAFLEKLETRLNRYGFVVASNPLWISNGDTYLGPDYDCYTPSGDYIPEPDDD